MIEEIFKRFKIKAKKSLWQNFLVDEFILEDIADYLDIEDKNIVEVWPWYWALTEKLLNNSPESLTLVELDKDMVNILDKRIEANELNTSWLNFQLLNTDVLKFEPVDDKYCVIANIPYYITSPILRHFLYDTEKKPESMIILMQKDVWDKILLWQLESKKIVSGVLSLFIAKKTFVKEVAVVPKESFIPAPKVESSVLHFESHDLYKEIDDEKFLKIIKIWFSSPRKKLIKNFVHWGFDKTLLINVFKELWMDENIRWEVLWIKDWCKLVENL